MADGTEHAKTGMRDKYGYTISCCWDVNIPFYDMIQVTLANIHSAFTISQPRTDIFIALTLEISEKRNAVMLQVV